MNHKKFKYQNKLYSKAKKVFSVKKKLNFHNESAAPMDSTRTSSSLIEMCIVSVAFSKFLQKKNIHFFLAVKY